MNISTIFNQSGLLYDRFLNDLLILPYSYDQIKIGENEIVTADIFNLKLSYLFQNFLYLYKCTQIASNLIPISAVATAGVSASSNFFTWNHELSTSQFINLTAVGLVNVDQTKVVNVQPNTALSQYSIFTSAGPDLVIFNSPTSNATISLALSTKEIYPNANIFFQDVVSITFDNQNNMYVLDLSANSLFKYDATGFLTNDNIFTNTLQYKTSIGGIGNISDKTKFSSPRSVTFSAPYLYILDSGNSCVKKYDTGLNWIFTYQLTRDLLSAYPIDLKIDSLSGNIWILAANNTIIQYSPDFSTKTVIDISTLQTNNEQFLSLNFSSQDDNILYLVSNQNVYKKLVDNPQVTIGKYLFYLFNYNTAEIIQAFSTLKVDGGDQSFIFSSANGVGKLGVFFDNINLDSILSVRDFDIYSLPEIYGSSQEYLQNWVCNKSLLKLLNNHIRLAELFIGKFTGNRDSQSNIVYNGLRYLTYNELQTVNFTYDISYFIGVNEILQNIIFNRAFLKLYKIQQAFLNILEDEVDASFDINTVVFLG